MVDLDRSDPSPSRRPGRPPRGVRAVAADILTRVDAGAYADALIQAARTRRALDTRDLGLLQEIVLGTLSRRGWIVHVLAVYANRPAGRNDPERIMSRFPGPP